MLYALQDATVRAMAPLAYVADIGSWWTKVAESCGVPAQGGLHAGFRLLSRLARTYDKPRFGITTVEVAGEVIAVTESAHSALPFCVLRHFSKKTPSPGPKLLVVAPLSGHHATLLRGTVQALLENHDVYITDWVDARQVPLSQGAFDLSSYVEYVQHFVRELGPEVHVLAVCQPCVPVLAAVSLMEQNNELVVPRSMTLIAGPVDVRANPTSVNQFATSHDLAYFRDQLIELVPAGRPGFMRKVYPGFKQLAAFVFMNKDKHAQAYREFYEAARGDDKPAIAKHEQFYDEYNAVLDLPAEFYLETIEKIFIEPQLAKGKLHLCGQRVDTSAIKRTALLTIEGGKDDITGLGQTHAAQALCSALSSSKKWSLTVDGVGHYGSFSGSSFKSKTVPEIVRFIKAIDA